MKKKEKQQFGCGELLGGKKYKWFSDFQETMVILQRQKINILGFFPLRNIKEQLFKENDSLKK